MWVYATRALAVDPMAIEIYQCLATLSPHTYKNLWLKHANLATSDHLV